jgi:CheY-like chemotaxis protein
MEVKQRVLLVMDNVPLRALLQLSIEMTFTIEAQKSDNPQEALEILDKSDGELKLIISDFTFGSKENQLLKDRLKELNKSAEFILLSGQAKNFDVLREQIGIGSTYPYQDMLVSLNNELRYFLPRNRFQQQEYVQISLPVISFFSELPGDI